MADNEQNNAAVERTSNELGTTGYRLPQAMFDAVHPADKVDEPSEPLRPVITADDQKQRAGVTQNKAAVRSPANKSATATSSETDTSNATLDDVAFASSAARELAEEEGLTAADFGVVKPSGDNDRFTKGDVQNVVDSKQS